MLRREFLAAEDLTWSGEVSGNSCERARRALLKAKRPGLHRDALFYESQYITE